MCANHAALLSLLPHVFYHAIMMSMILQRTHTHHFYQQTMALFVALNVQMTHNITVCMLIKALVKSLTTPVEGDRAQGVHGCLPTFPY